MDPLPLPTGKYSLTTAIARQEGYYAGNTRSYRNCNPGDVMWDGPNGFAAQHGALHGDNGPHTPMAVFADATTGFRAYRVLLNRPAVFYANRKDDPLGLASGYVGATVEQVLNRYCPGNAPGNTPAGTAQYIRNVCDWMECRPTDVLTVGMI